MKSGEKCALPPAPSPCCAPKGSSPALVRKSFSRSKPVRSLFFGSRMAASTRGVMLACRFWLTLSVTLISSLSGAEICSAIACSGTYDAARAERSRNPGSGSTSTPFSRKASVKTVSAKRVGDGTTYLKRIGDLPAGKLPEIVTFCLLSVAG